MSCDLQSSPILCCRMDGAYPTVESYKSNYVMVQNLQPKFMCSLVLDLEECNV